MEIRKTIKKSKRFDVLKRDNFTCQYCGRSAPDVELEIDHLKPVSRGGSNDIENLVTSCKDCNRAKRDQEFAFNPKSKKIKEMFYNLLYFQKTETLDRYEYLLELKPKLRYFLITLEKLYVFHGEKYIFGFINKLFDYYEEYTLEQFLCVLKSDYLLEPLIPAETKLSSLEDTELFFDVEYPGKYEFMSEVWSLITDDINYILNGTFQKAFEFFFETYNTKGIDINTIKIVAFESRTPDVFISNLQDLIDKE